ncbi:MAG: tetratricopeptide repeat protein [Smithellaceae bacterium]
MRKLDESRKHLREGNLFSAILALRETLEGFLSLKNIHPNDTARLTNAMNDFQQKIAESQEFQTLYGQVRFRDHDYATSLDFLSQLIHIKEDEIAGMIQNEDFSNALTLNTLGANDQKTVRLMVSLVEQGEQAALKMLVQENDELGSLVMAYYNEAGIGLRVSGDLEKAVTEYKKAISVSPQDEHLFYNLARAYIEAGLKESAESAVEQALKINPDFSEGHKLKRYIREWTKD